MGNVLQLRRTADGLRVVGDPPAEHTFTAQFVAKVLADGGSLRLTIPTTSDDLVYDVTGFEVVESGDIEDPDDRLNFNAWTCELVTP